MKKHHEILADVNALRAQLNMKPLKDWKGSNADLLATRTNLKAKLAAQTPEPKITNSQVEDVKEIKKSKPATRTTDKAEGKTDRFLGVAPKIARAKLRKAFGSDWKNKTAAEIAAVLKPKKA